MELQDLRELPLNQTSEEMKESRLAVCGPQVTQPGQGCNMEALCLSNAHVPHIHMVTNSQYKLCKREREGEVDEKVQVQ